MAFNLHYLRTKLGLTTGALIALIVGTVCGCVALMLGLIGALSAPDENQTSHSGLTQWLLAAATAFIAGILLKE